LKAGNTMFTYMNTPVRPTYWAEIDTTLENRGRLRMYEGLYTHEPRRGKVGVTGPKKPLVALLKETGGGRLFLTKPDGEIESWDILPAIPPAAPTSKV
jgi:hypothetical protein